jgi:sec-independent protein translocase protein TatC
MADVIDQVRAGLTDRAELPGMTLMEHLQELRKRLISAIVWLAVGVGIAAVFTTRLVAFIQKPLKDVGLSMTMTHPTDALELDIKTAIVFGIIGASPFILYQVWLFIAPGLYANEKKYVLPFMSTTVGLFLAGAWFGYHWVLPDTIKILVLGFGKNFNHMITIDDYTGFFLAVILGLGLCFELPILMFFLSLFGLVDAKFFLKQWRYAVLAIFLIAAMICPNPEPVGMALFASPMLGLYIVGIVISYYVHPKYRNRKEPKPS